MSRIRVFLVDDHPVVRNGIRAMLEDEADLEIVGEAETATQAIERIAALVPDVALLDLRLPDMTGVEVIRKSRASHVSSRFIILTTFDVDDLVFEAFQAGAYGYLLKDAAVEDIVAAIHKVNKGGRLLPPPVAERLAEWMAQPALTPREKEVLEHVALGESNKIIAVALGVSEGTVKSHVVRIFDKLQVDDRTAAVTVALHKGIIRLRP